MLRPSIHLNLIVLVIFGQDCNLQRSWIRNLYAVERLAVLFLILDVLGSFMIRKLVGLSEIFSSFPVRIACKLMHSGYFDITFVARVQTVSKES
jgi:hypothetical protein